MEDDASSLEWIEGPDSKMKLNDQEPEEAKSDVSDDIFLECLEPDEKKDETPKHIYAKDLRAKYFKYMEEQKSINNKKLVQ